MHKFLVNNHTKSTEEINMEPILDQFSKFVKRDGDNTYFRGYSVYDKNGEPIVIMKMYAYIFHNPGINETDLKNECKVLSFTTTLRLLIMHNMVKKYPYRNDTIYYVNSPDEWI